MCLAPSADLSLPSGGGFCIDTESGPQYLVHFLLLCWPLPYGPLYLGFLQYLSFSRFNRLQFLVAPYSFLLNDLTHQSPKVGDKYCFMLAYEISCDSTLCRLDLSATLFMMKTDLTVIRMPLFCR